MSEGPNIQLTNHTQHNLKPMVSKYLADSNVTKKILTYVTKKTLTNVTKKTLTYVTKKTLTAPMLLLI